MNESEFWPPSISVIPNEAEIQLAFADTDASVVHLLDAFLTDPANAESIQPPAHPNGIEPAWNAIQQQIQAARTMHVEGPLGVVQPFIWQLVPDNWFYMTLVIIDDGAGHQGASTTAGIPLESSWITGENGLLAEGNEQRTLAELLNRNSLPLYLDSHNVEAFLTDNEFDSHQLLVQAVLIAINNLRQQREQGEKG